jgi:aminoglycoside 3-N-acetyltransferase
MLTERSLAAQLAAVGLGPAPGVLVHSSLSRLGRLEFGPATLHAALKRVVGRRCTIMVPATTSNNSLTSRAHLAAVRDMNERERAAYIEGMPGFDRRTTPTYEVGTFAEYIRTHRRSTRSTHPQTSFAAIGPQAARWTAIHDLDCHLGHRSPLGALASAGAHVLLAGVGFEHCTAFHLAEYKVRNRLPDRTYQCFVNHGYDRQQVTFQALDLFDGDFAVLGSSMQQESFVKTGRVGETWATIFPIREAVDFAVRWMDLHPARGLGEALSRAHPGDSTTPQAGGGEAERSGGRPKGDR